MNSLPRGGMPPPFSPICFLLPPIVARVYAMTGTWAGSQRERESRPNMVQEWRWVRVVHTPSKPNWTTETNYNITTRSVMATRSPQRTILQASFSKHREVLPTSMHDTAQHKTPYIPLAVSSIRPRMHALHRLIRGAICRKYDNKIHNAKEASDGHVCVCRWLEHLTGTQ